MEKKQYEIADFAYMREYNESTHFPIDSSFVYNLLANLNLDKNTIHTLIALIDYLEFASYKQGYLDATDYIIESHPNFRDSFIQPTIDNINKISEKRKEVNDDIIKYYMNEYLKYKQSLDLLKSQQTQ